MRSRQRKVLRSMSAFHTQREREEKKKASEAEKERIRALKENDEEAYMKLLEDTKNDRLLTLVRETDSALYSLGAKIRAHKTGGDASAAASLDAAVNRRKDKDSAAEPQDGAARGQATVNAAYCCGLTVRLLVLAVQTTRACTRTC